MTEPTTTTTITTTPTTEPMHQELTGHTSPDTAYLVTDYPYGFRLRTEIRYWIETRKGHGQRTMSQTRNPKRAGMPWNAPKGSIYAPIRVMLLNPTNGHVEHEALSPYAEEPEIAAFAQRYPKTCAEPRNRGVVDLLIAHRRAYQQVTWTVRSGRPEELQNEPRQSAADQVAIIRRLTIEELKKLKAERGEL
jgi:hypothetical protein